MRFGPSIIAALLLCGCATGTRYVAENFRTTPREWTVIEDDREYEARDLGVAAGRLELRGARVLCRQFLFSGTFRGHVDFAFAGGESEGFAGVFVEQVTEPRTILNLSFSAAGAWRAYSGDSLLPAGGPRWSRVRGEAIVKPFRVTIERSGEHVVMGLDGDSEVRASFVLPGVVTRPRDGEPQFRVGVFTYLVDLAINSFVVGEDGEDAEDGTFDPEAHVHRGDADDAATLLRVVDRRVDEFARSPRRLDFLGLLEPLLWAREIFERAGDAGTVENIRFKALRVCSDARNAIEVAGAEDLLAMAISGWGFTGEERTRLLGGQLQRLRDRAREARDANRPAEELIYLLAATELDRSGDSLPEIESLERGVLLPLAVDFVTEDASARERVGEGRSLVASKLDDFARAATDAYGALPRAEDGALEIRVIVEKAIRDRDRAAATRSLAVSSTKTAVTIEMIQELRELEKRFPEDLRDAATSALVMRKGNLTPESSARLARVAFPGLDVDETEILVSDMPTLRETANRILELRGARDREAARNLRTVKTSATSVTDLVWFRARCEVALDGRVISRRMVETRDGIEQWVHPADESRGVAASRYDESRATSMIEAARRRTIARLATAISKNSVLSDLSRHEATALVMRMARASRGEEDVRVLRWRLQTEYGLSGETLEHVTRELLD